MDLYQRIVQLCDAHNVRPGRMCVELGISRGIITDLKMGRKQTLSADTLGKIAHYFGITVDELRREGPLPPIATPDSDTVMILARKRKNLTPEQVRQVIGMTRVLFGDDFWDDVEDVDASEDGDDR